MEYIQLFWRPVVEICILWFIFYRMLLFFQGTRAFQLLRGIVILVIAFFISQRLGMLTIEWLLTKLFAFWLIAIIVIFQPELRQALARLGQQQLFHLPPKEEELVQMIRELIKAVRRFSYEKIGAIIAIERQQKLNTYIESGVRLDSILSAELLSSVFEPGGPLHDGGVVVAGNRIVAAACLFPLTQQSGLAPTLGTRHRAAIGMSEETDAVVLVVSEERGVVSLALHGRLTSNLEMDKLESFLKDLLSKDKLK